jgi:hypothetical protein
MRVKNKLKKKGNAKNQVGARGSLDAKMLALHAGLKFCDPADVSDEQLSRICSQIENDLHEIRSGDLSLIEEHLYSQCVALQAMFDKMFQACMLTTAPQVKMIYGKLALKSQNQCRATLTSLAELKHPKKAMFIKQQNNAINQQVNSASPSVDFPKKIK